MDDHIINALPDPVILIDGERRIAGSNTASWGLLGTIYKGEDLSLTLRHPDILRAVDAVLDGAETQKDEVSFSHPVTRTFELSVSTIPGSGAALEDARILLVLHDITATRAAENVRSEFIANVSHELRSPLVSLIGFLETLQTSAKDDPDAQDRFLAIMADEASRMRALIDDLLSLSKIEANEHNRPQGQVNLEHVLRTVCETLGQKAERKAMTIDVVCKDPVSDIPGDLQELIQVFTNLIDNAVKYGTDNSAVTVTIEAVNRIPDLGVKGVRVTVRNFGETIAPEHLPRLTERFYRIDKGRSRSVGGTGLGLAIVKHMVNHHRGRLVIESSPENGTLFSVFLRAGNEKPGRTG